MSWKLVTRDPNKQTQCTRTYSTKDGSVTSQVIYTYIANASDTTSEDVTTCEAASGPDGSGGTLTIPATGSIVELMDGNNYTVTRTYPRQIGPTTFEIQLTCEYDYIPTPATDKFNVTVRISGQQYTQQAYYDKDDNPIQNSAGQAFDPSVNEVFYDERIEVSYSATSDQSAAFDSVRGTVNNGSISFAIQGISRTFDERTLLCEDVEQTDTLPLTGSTAPTYKVVASFLHRVDGFQDKVLDKGPDGNLDGSGNLGGPVFLTFKIQTEADFNTVFTGLA